MNDWKQKTTRVQQDIAFRVGWEDLVFHAGTAGTFPENGNRVRVASEMVDVISNPSTRR